jgi:hypothetical protein
MHRYVAIAFLAVLSLVPFGASAPVGGTYSERNEIISEPWRTTRIFQGGERASVFALGDRPDEEFIGKLHVKVFDAKGNLVAEDAGSNSLVGDFVGVSWYPARTAEYRVEVHTEKSNKVWIAIK